jgi:hypothetical protein
VVLSKKEKRTEMIDDIIYLGFVYSGMPMQEK